MKTEHHILDMAVQALTDATRLEVRVYDNETVPVVHEQRVQYRNGVLPANKLTIGNAGKRTTYLVRVERRITPDNAGIVAHQIHAEDSNNPLLLVTEYLQPGAAETLRAHKVQYIDTVGNAYIDTAGVFILIQGMKRRKENVRYHGTGTTGEKHGTTELFGWAGLKVLFVFLCAPEFLEKNYRTIARAAGTAVGTVAGVMSELKRRGYILEVPGIPPRLLRKKELAERWTLEYAERLRPKQFLGRYAPGVEVSTETVREAGAEAGGETAAWRMQRYLIPAMHTVYTETKNADTIVGLRLRAQTDGTVELRERFWDFDYPGRGEGIVPLLLVYADLIAEGDPRTIETAQKLYDEYLAERFRED